MEFSRSPLVYAAEDAALAVLEVRVHLDLTFDLLPEDYVLMEIDIKDSTIEYSPFLADMGKPADFGDACLASRRSPLLRIRSAIVRESFNVLINPSHPEASTVAIKSVRAFSFDERLWRPRA